MKRTNLIALILVFAATVAACSKSSNPSSPSSVSGVTVNGSIMMQAGGASGSTSGASTMSGPSASTMPSGLQVSVVGTAISAIIDATGQFSLKNVPPGNAELRFTFPGFAAGVGLLDLQSGQTVTIQVSLGTSSATLESERRALGSEVQLEGRVELLTPTPTPPSLVVAGQTVTTDANTLFFLHGKPAVFADLELGQRVHVKGQTTGSGATASLLARVVDIQNTNTSVGLNLNGVISGFTGTRSAFEFTVNGQLVKGDANTEFFGNSQFLELVDGVTVETKGSQRSGYVYAARIHVEVEDVEFTAAISALTGTAPDLTLTIGAYTVKTSDLTDVRRQGDVQAVSNLDIGQTVTVTGGLLPGSVVIARKISIEADAVGGKFEMEGTMSSKSGTCPTLSFSVSGYAITTNNLTAFTPSCGSFSNGTKVLVKGTVQANLSVLATVVQKQ